MRAPEHIATRIREIAQYLALNDLPALVISADPKCPPRVVAPLLTCAQCQLREPARVEEPRP